MKRLSTICLLSVAIYICTAANIKLKQFYNYSNQYIPEYITRDNQPDSNIINDTVATLGRVLFYDKKLSVNNQVSCASCHKQKFAFSDTAALSTGVNGKTGRHSMRLVNTRFGDEEHFFWDERANSLEVQCTMPIHNAIEMGYAGASQETNIKVLIQKLGTTTYYPTLFKMAFGDDNISEKRLQLALAQFIRSIQSFDSKFDAGYVEVKTISAPFPNFTEQENLGKDLFLLTPRFNKEGVRISHGAGCGNCHRAPEFSIDAGANNNGMIIAAKDSVDMSNTRSPSLRDLFDEKGAPFGGFMHSAGNNQFVTIRDVINHYDSIKVDNENLDNRLRPYGYLQRLRLTENEKDALEAFLRTLTGHNIYTDKKWADPFSNDSLDFQALYL